ncbi:MAG TPA: TonB-dependent receptor plug domain-containing protein [Rhodothermales bacterium]|nr:TonB-dependent receptor plug domain-containing protein [Rhodothermales bacterium]
MKGHPLVRRTCLLLGTILFLSVNLDCTSSSVTATNSTESASQGNGSMLTSEDIRNSPSMDVWQLLAAHVSGVDYNGGKLRIRGVHTLQGSNEPLYVVDGVELSSQPFLNRYNVEYIKVLKGAEASIYGVRGGNGVIVVKTKIQN